MTSLLEKQKTIMDQLVAGDFVTGMENFYADDAVNEEATGATVQGREQIIANEKQFLEGVKEYHGCTVHAVGSGSDDGNGNGVTFAQYDLKADLKDGSTFNPKQVQVTRWVDGKAKHIRFYYDPAQL